MPTKNKVNNWVPYKFTFPPDSNDAWTLEKLQLKVDIENTVILNVSKFILPNEHNVANWNTNIISLFLSPETARLLAIALVKAAETLEKKKPILMELVSCPTVKKSEIIKRRFAPKKELTLNQLRNAKFDVCKAADKLNLENISRKLKCPNKSKYQCPKKQPGDIDNGLPYCRKCDNGTDKMLRKNKSSNKK